MTRTVALRRWLVGVGVVVGGTAVVSLLVGLAAGTSAQRAVSLGFYAVGCLAMVIGFAFGTQNPFRGLADRKGPEEHRENRVIAVVLIVGGLLLLLIGVGVDSRVHVV